MEIRREVEGMVDNYGDWSRWLADKVEERNRVAAKGRERGGRWLGLKKGGSERGK